MTAALWKGIALALLVALLATAGAMGYHWNLAAHDRDEKADELVIEKGVSEQLRLAIGKQSDAVKAAAGAKKVAEVRGDQARQLANATARRYELALQRERDTKASTCAEAMETVNRVLEAVQ